MDWIGLVLGKRLSSCQGGNPSISVHASYVKRGPGPFMFTASSALSGSLACWCILYARSAGLTLLLRS